MRTAIVTGISGQDGAYLSRLLLSKGYYVIGAYRRSASQNFWRLKELGVLEHHNLKLVDYDLTDLSSAVTLINHSKPQEIYNLAAQSFVGTSFNQPLSTSHINAIGTLNLLEAIKIVDLEIRFYQASTSEMFGKVQDIPQNENTPFYPRSPYGISKLFAHWMTVNYRESYGLYGVSGILFNHESPMRGLEFVTRKITNSVAKIDAGMQDTIKLGNLNSQRDWGYADDYVQGMWSMLQQSNPDDFVLSTGRTESVREFVRMSFSAIGIDLKFHGSGESEIGIDASSGRKLVEVDPQFYRPAEVDLLVGDSKKANKILNWSSKTSLEELCKMMVMADKQRIKQDISY